MVMGCCSRWGKCGAAARSLRAVHAGVAAAGRLELAAVHRVRKGGRATSDDSCGREPLIAEFSEGVVAAFEEFARNGQGRALVPEPGGCL